MFHAFVDIKDLQQQKPFFVNNFLFHELGDDDNGPGQGTN